MKFKEKNDPRNCCMRELINSFRPSKVVLKGLLTKCNVVFSRFQRFQNSACVPKQPRISEIRREPA